MKSGEPPRTVKPRQPKADTRPVIALSRDLIVVESLRDEVFGADELGQVLKLAPPSIIVCQGFGKHLERLEREFRENSEFNYRVTPIRRYSRPWDDGRRMEQGMILDAICNFVGWRGRNDEGKTTWTHYHYPLDPVWFLTTSIEDIDDRPDIPRIVKLYEWGKNVRDWCLRNRVTVKASAGGIAAQLLRDPRFYPEPRRKAPKLINDRARFQLPGNYYRLHANVGTSYNAIHIDMENAHHAMARILRFPDVDYLHAHGYWAADSPSVPESERKLRQFFAPGNSPIRDTFGLFHARISVPHLRGDRFPPPYMERGGEADCFLYSNELELVESLGGRILGFYAAYTSHKTDEGLNRYARWAIEEIRTNRDQKSWLKPTLHATYGLLAARPVPFETGYYRADGGYSTSYPMGNAAIPAIAKRRTKEVESQIVNVIHRGMIEAEVRKQALWMARFLTEAYGHRILAIYADAIFVEDCGRGLPLLEPPWIWKGYVKHVRWFDPTSFVSPSLSRLPGIPRTARERFLQSKALSEEIRKRPKRSTAELEAVRNRNRVARNMHDGVPLQRSRPRSRS